MQLHVLYAWSLGVILTLSVYGEILKTFDDGSRECEMYRMSLYPIDRLDKLMDGSIKNPYLTWIDEVQITDQENGFIINVTGRVDIPKYMPVICWDSVSAEIKTCNTRLGYLDPDLGCDLDDDITKTISPTDLISMVQQNIINKTDEYVVFNFDIYDHANRQCVYLSKSNQRVAVNCSQEFPALCYGTRKQQISTVISISKLCPENLKSSSELTPNDDKLPSACNKLIPYISTNANMESSVSVPGTQETGIIEDDISKESDATTSSSEIARVQSGSSSAIDGMTIFIIVGAVFGVLIISIVVIFYLKRCRRGKSDNNHEYLTATTNQNTTDDTHRYAVPTVYENTSEDVTVSQAYAHDYISVI